VTRRWSARDRGEHHRTDRLSQSGSRSHIRRRALRADPSRADHRVSPSGEVTSVRPPDAFRCKHYGAAVPGAFRLHGEPPQLNVPAMEGHLHRQDLAEWRRLTVNVDSTAQLPAVLVEACESPLVEPEGR
jgi:hypothetical protein